MNPFPAISPRDLTESHAAVFGRSPMEYAIDRDQVRAIAEARALERDGLDTTGTQAAIVTTLNHVDRKTP